nr:hypothetical protein [Tanacetum cinerariifolium]
ITSNHGGDFGCNSDNDSGSDSSRIRGLEVEQRLKAVAEGEALILKE